VVGSNWLLSLWIFRRRLKFSSAQAIKAITA